MPFVVVIMGSKSDWQVMKECIAVLKKFEIPFELHISSAHRTPERTKEIVLDAVKRGAEVFIGAAGMAAHLAGSIAAHTLKPVIAVPLTGGMLDGLDSLLSSVQMPQAVPVATMGIGKAGAINAAFLATQILSLLPQYTHLSKLLIQERQERAQKLEEDTKDLQNKIANEEFKEEHQRYEVTKYLIQ